MFWCTWNVQVTECLYFIIVYSTDLVFCESGLEMIEIYLLLKFKKKKKYKLEQYILEDQFILAILLKHENLQIFLFHKQLNTILSTVFKFALLFPIIFSTVYNHIFIFRFPLEVDEKQERVD